MTLEAILAHARQMSRADQATLLSEVIASLERLGIGGGTREEAHICPSCTRNMSPSSKTGELVCVYCR